MHLWGGNTLFTSSLVPATTVWFLIINIMIYIYLRIYIYINIKRDSVYFLWKSMWWHRLYIPPPSKGAQWGISILLEQTKPFSMKQTTTFRKYLQVQSYGKGNLYCTSYVFFLWQAGHGTKLASWYNLEKMRSSTSWGGANLGIFKLPWSEKWPKLPLQNLFNTSIPFKFMGNHVILGIKWDRWQLLFNKKKNRVIYPLNKLHN